MRISVTLAAFLIASLLPIASAEAATSDAHRASVTLAKAEAMLGVTYVYGGVDPKKGLDCSAYVSLAWNVPRQTTETLHQVTNRISKDQLLPGDALNMDLPGPAGHVRIFDKWATTDKALVWVYEATEPISVHQVIPWDPRYVPVRRVNAVTDVAMPPPPPLPAGKQFVAPPRRIVGNGVLAGRVIDDATGQPIGAARVFFWTAKEQYRVESVVTDRGGRFTIPRLAAGDYEIAAYATGFDVDMLDQVTVATNRTTPVEFKLTVAGSSGANTRLHSGKAAFPHPISVPSGDPPTSLPLDYPVAGGHFFTQTAGRDGVSGFTVTNDRDIRFWDEFRRLGGVNGVGYPVSRRFVWRGFTVQAMQKGVLQWRADVGQAWLTNVFDELHDAGKDGWLQGFRSTPPPLPASFDTGKDWNAIVRARVSLLDADPAIRARYRSVDDPMTFFGLPTSRVTDQGNHYAIRLQRAVIQLWKVNVPWASAGEVTIANGADVAKEAGLFPSDAIQPQRSPLLRD